MSVEPFSAFCPAIESPTQKLCACVDEFNYCLTAGCSGSKTANAAIRVEPSRLFHDANVRFAPDVSGSFAKAFEP